MSFAAIVLAAGQGKRMKSARPKMLFPIAGRPLLYFSVRAASDAGAGEIVVVASPRDRDKIEDYVTRAVDGAKVSVTVQSEPRGTGDAARAGLAALSERRDWVAILYGDTPLLHSEDVSRLVETARSGAGALALLSCVVADPTGYGRILRDESGALVGIKEQRDLETDAERAVREINAGVYVSRAKVLEETLSRLSPDNAQGEYYLTDIVPAAVRSGGAVALEGNPDALIGVNDRAQLAVAEGMMYTRIAERHAQSGATIRGDPRIDDTVELGPDVEVMAGVCLRGSTVVEEGAMIDVGCVVDNSTIRAGAKLKPYSVVTDSEVGERAEVGPFSHLRPGSVLGPEARVGNFVETKKTRLGRGSKANHLAYLGDGQIGERVNIGAGTIFCNYDGFGKHTTIVEDGAFIGSDSQVVAPVTIGKGSYVATGATVTKDVPADALAISRVKQENKLDYGPKLRARLGSRAKAKKS